MIKHWTNKLRYILPIFIILCLNILHIDADIESLLKKAGIAPPIPLNQISETVTDVPAMSRIFYSAIGDLVETVPVFPITFNVPDMVTAFSGLLSGVFNYIIGNNNSDGSEPKDVLGAMINIYRHIAVQEDIHDIEFMT